MMKILIAVLLFIFALSFDGVNSQSTQRPFGNDIWQEIAQHLPADAMIRLSSTHRDLNDDSSFRNQITSKLLQISQLRDPFYQGVLGGSSPAYFRYLRHHLRRNINREYPLHHAITENQPHVFEWFINQSDVNVNQRYGENEDTALHLAAVHPNPYFVHALRQRTDLDMNAQNKFGQTPLTAAVLFDHQDPQALALQELMHDARVDKLSRRSNGRLPIHEWAAYGNTPAILDILLAHGADINSRVHQNTPLHLAVNYNNEMAAKELLKHRNALDLHATDLFQKTAHDYAKMRRRFVDLFAQQN